MITALSSCSLLKTRNLSYIKFVQKRSAAMKQFLNVLITFSKILILKKMLTMKTNILQKISSSLQEDGQIVFY